MARLFVAVWPPAFLLTWLRDLERPVRPGLRWTTEDQWHVTVRFLGGLDEEAQGRLRAGLGEVAAGFGPVVAAAGPALRALGRGVWVLPVEGLDTLAARLAAATGEVGEPPPARPFRGHITLARARRPGALAGLGVLAGSPAGGLAGHWSVTEITLVQSELRPDGARYTVLERWPLQGR